MTESTLTRRILKALNARPQTKAIKLHGSRYQEAGTPDVLCVSEGRVFFFEVKLPGEEATPLQLQRIKEWIAAGARAYVISSAREAMEYLVEVEDELKVAADFLEENGFNNAAKVLRAGASGY